MVLAQTSQALIAVRRKFNRQMDEGKLSVQVITDQMTLHQCIVATRTLRQTDGQTDFTA